MSSPSLERGSLARQTSIRKLTKILRPRRTTVASSLGVVPDADGPTPPSSPSLYSLSSENDSHPKFSSETEGTNVGATLPLTSPTLSTFSSSASEGQGDDTSSELPRRVVPPVAYVNPESGLVHGSTEPNMPWDVPALVPTPNSPHPPKNISDYAKSMSRGYGSRPRHIITTDQDGRLADTDASSLRIGGKWGERARLQPLAPSEWLGSNAQAKSFLGVGQLSPVESENRSPMDASSSSSSPSTPRQFSDIKRTYLAGGSDLDLPPYTSRSHTINVVSEFADPGSLTEHRRRPRAVSEPRSFPGTQLKLPRHADTYPAAPSTPTEYTTDVPTVDSVHNFSSSPTIAPPPRNSSLPSPDPEDVYYTAAGRRESRMYLSPDTTSDRVLISPMRRGHSHSSSDPVFTPDLDKYSSTSMRYATWNSSRMHESSSGRPFDDAISRGMTSHADGESTPVSRKELLWSGEWNRDDIQEVIQELRALK